MTKTKTLHRHLHPIHWHGSMVLAIAAILLTSVRTSGEMVKALQAVPIHSAVINDLFLRDAENVHLPIILSAGLRHATQSGK